MKTKFIQVQSNWFSSSSKEAPAYKKSAKARCCELFFLHLSLLKKIPETEYLTSWLQKISLE